jgi:hypothetical protein
VYETHPSLYPGNVARSFVAHSATVGWALLVLAGCSWSVSGFSGGEVVDASTPDGGANRSPVDGASTPTADGAAVATDASLDSSPSSSGGSAIAFVQADARYSGGLTGSVTLHGVAAHDAPHCRGHARFDRDSERH